MVLKMDKYYWIQIQLKDPKPGLMTCLFPNGSSWCRYNFLINNNQRVYRGKP